MVKKNNLPAKPRNRSFPTDSNRDIDLSKNKVSIGEKWLNEDISDPDFQSLFKRVKSFYHGSCTVPLYIPDDLAPVLNRAMAKFNFSNNYEAFLYILTLKSCRYVADYVSGTMYDYALDHALSEISDERHLAVLRSQALNSNSYFPSEYNPDSFAGRAVDLALTTAEFYSYINGSQTVRSHDLSEDDASDSPLYTERYPSGIRKFSNASLHALASRIVNDYPDMSPNDFFNYIDSLKNRLSELSARFDTELGLALQRNGKLTVELESLESKLKESEANSLLLQEKIRSLNGRLSYLQEEYMHGVLFLLMRVANWIKRRFFDFPP